MATLENIGKNLKKSILGIMLGSSFGLLGSMVNLTEEVDDNTVEAAVENTVKENPEMAEELGKVVEIVKLDEQVLYEMQKNILDYSNAFGTVENEKDEDGYNKIEYKFVDINAKVSEEQALKNEARAKGGRTRVDEE